MSGSTRFQKSPVNHIDRDPAKLHPLMRAAVREVEMMCEAEQIPFKMFEGYRTPQRQHHLFLQGRVSSRPGHALTNSEAWWSFHQFGMAADFALVWGDDWTFDTSPGASHLWVRLKEIGEQIYGLEAVEHQDVIVRGISGHLQLAGFEIEKLRAGSYPSGGDKSWAENLADNLNKFPLTRTQVPA